jgi:hypothetical protein
MTANDDDLQLPRVGEQPDPAAERLLRTVEVACDRHADFAAKVESALRVTLASLGSRPDLARLLTVEPYIAGKDAARHHRHLLECFGDLLRVAAESGTDAPSHPPFVEPTIVAGVASQISRCVLADRGEQLEQLLPELLEFMLAFYLDSAEVNRIGRAARESPNP